MKKVSLLMLTINRKDITTATLRHNIAACAPYDVELLVCDNGSNDGVIEAIAAFPELKYHRINSRNEGVAHSFNQLYLRAKGDYVVLLGNDIQLPAGWLMEAIKYLDGVPKVGIVGIDWGHGHVPPMVASEDGIIAHWLTPQLNRVFGVWAMRRELLEAIGFFHEGFDVYGIEDSDFNERVNRAGYRSLYLPFLKSQHLCNDVGERSDYRKMKDASLSKNLGIFMERVKAFDAGATLVEPLPPMRDPL